MTQSTLGVGVTHASKRGQRWRIEAMPSLESSAATPLCSNADHIAATAGDRDLDSGDLATSACPLFEALQTENARFEYFEF